MIRFIINVFLKSSIIIILTVVSLVAFIEKPVFAEEKNEKIYAKKGIVEIEGSIGFSYTGTPAIRGNSLNLNFNPIIHYFIADGLHIGLSPNIGLSYSDGEYYNISGLLYTSKYISLLLGPGVITGYAFTLSPNSLFLDLSGSFYYIFSVYESYNQGNTYKSNSYYFNAGLDLKLKYIIHNSSINTGLFYRYKFSEFGADNHNIGISLGFSIYF